MYNVYICIYIVNKVCSHPPQGNSHKVGPPPPKKQSQQSAPPPSPEQWRKSLPPPTSPPNYMQLYVIESN